MNNIRNVLGSYFCRSGEYIPVPPVERKEEHENVEEIGGFYIPFVNVINHATKTGFLRPMSNDNSGTLIVKVQLGQYKYFDEAVKRYNEADIILACEDYKKAIDLHDKTLALLGGFKDYNSHNFYSYPRSEITIFNNKIGCTSTFNKEEILRKICEYENDLKNKDV